MRNRDFRAFVLASALAVNAALVPLGVAKADAPAAPAPAETRTETTSPAQMPSNLSDKLKTQTMDKMAARDQLASLPSIGGARPGEALDTQQPSVAETTKDKLGEGAVNGFAYVGSYVEPNDYAHRNYCGAGAATVLLSHWDAELPKNVDIDQIGREINIDPDSGAWIKDIVDPVNQRLSEKAGHEVHWYRYGQAQSKDELRWMLDVDIRQNGVPLITGMDTAGMPGWGSDVGHIIAVYGYWQGADGKEYVSYVDTAPSSSGYHGDVFVTVELGTFWDAVSGNSAQVW